MNEMMKVKQPYLRFREGRDIFIPNFVLEAIGLPSQMELMWLDKALLIYECTGVDPELLNLLPEGVRQEHGGQVIKRLTELERMKRKLKTRFKDIFIPGYYTAFSGYRSPGAIAQIAAFQLNEEMPWKSISLSDLPMLTAVEVSYGQR